MTRVYDANYTPLTVGRPEGEREGMRVGLEEGGSVGLAVGYSVTGSTINDCNV